MRLTRPVRRCLLTGLSLLLAAGCSSPPTPVTVTGKVTRGGKPIALSKTEVLRVILTKEVPPGTNPVLLRVKTEADGSFTLPHVPPGKYRVALLLKDTATRRDVPEDASATQNTSFDMEIDGKKPLDLDLPQPAR